MSITYQGDKRKLSDVGTATTNDRGEYRIWGLAPGKYYVRATHPRGGAQCGRKHDLRSHTSYPGVSDLSRTQPIRNSIPATRFLDIDLAYGQFVPSMPNGRPTPILEPSTGPLNEMRKLPLWVDPEPWSMRPDKLSTDANGSVRTP